jgi:hypothetical protein
MSDFSDDQPTHISFDSISHEIKKILSSKMKLDEIFQQFTNQVNALNSYINLYQEQLKSSSNINDSDRSGKKKFCSNVNNNNVDECSNNNNNGLKKHRTCCYSETDPEGRVEYYKGKTELERHERLLEYQIKRVGKLREQKKRASLKEI